MWPLGQMLGPLGRALKKGVTYLLRDEFTTDAAAPLASPRTCEPGPGALTIVDSGSQMSISGGALILAGVRKNFGDPGVYCGPFTRSIGLTAIGRFDQLGPCFVFGFKNSASSYPTSCGIQNYSYQIRSNNFNVGGYYNLLQTTAYDIYVINTSFGGIFVVYRGIYAALTIYWVLYDPSYAALTAVYAGFGMYTEAPNAKVKDFKIAVLSSPWDSAYGVATGYTDSPASGASLAHEPDCIVRVAWTASAGAVFEMDVRRTDADNRWILRVSQAGGTMKLIQRQAGVETERASSAQSFTAGTQYELIVLAYGATIQTALKNGIVSSYGSATFNQTATTAMVTASAGALSTFVTWPRTLSGAALAALQEVSG